MDAPAEPRGEPAPGAPAPAASAASAAERGLKLVVTLRPTEGGYQALIALAADGCDPAFRSIAVDAIGAALAAVPALLEQAETRWREQPRYRAATTPGRRHDRAQPVAPAGTAPVPSAPASAGEQPPAAPPTRQLPLFG
jgi:hypothetical protein